MADPPLVSVVIPCRDPTFLGRQLESLALQGPEPAWDAVVVDNGSGDAVEVVVGGFSDRLPVRVVPAKEAQGAAYARNVGAESAGGDLLVFLDADDEVAPGYITAMARTLATSDLACARVDTVKLNGTSLYHPQQTGPITDEFGGFLPFAGAGTLGIRRRVYLDLGGFDQALPAYEEADLCWRAQLGGYTGPAFTPDAVLHLRVRTTAGAAFHQGRRWGRAQVTVYRRFRSQGLARKPLLKNLLGWLRPLVDLTKARSRRDLHSFVHAVGVRWGRLVGSIRERTLYL